MDLSPGILMAPAIARAGWISSTESWGVMNVDYCIVGGNQNWTSAEPSARAYIRFLSLPQDAYNVVDGNCPQELPVLIHHRQTQQVVFVEDLGYSVLLSIHLNSQQGIIRQFFQRRIAGCKNQASQRNGVEQFFILADQVEIVEVLEHLLVLAQLVHGG